MFENVQRKHTRTHELKPLDIYNSIFKCVLNCKKLLLVSSYMFVSLTAWKRSAPNGWIFTKFDRRIFRKFQNDLTRITGTLCMAIYVLLSLILCSITSFRKSCHLSDNVEKYERARQATHDNTTAA